jgi:hypothetical protein
MFRLSGARLGIMFAFAVAFPIVSAIADAVGAPSWVGWAAIVVSFVGYFFLMTRQGIRERDARLLSEGKIAMAPAQSNAEKPD